MAEFQIRITTRDDQQIEFPCPDDLDVVSAGEAAGIVLPSLCRGGGCGACLATCQHGDYRLERYSEAMLPEAARAHHEVLLCRTYPDSNLIIHAPYDAARISSAHNPGRSAEIIELTVIAENTVKLRLRYTTNGQNGQAVDFDPGQFMELEVPGSKIRRAYSLANTANWRGELEFMIRLQPGGAFSGYLQDQARLGEALTVYGPNGAFGLQRSSLNPCCFIAGGTGLAPFLSMLRRMAEWGEDHAIQLFFGVNHEGELFCLDELARLRDCIPGFQFEACLWQPKGDWSGFVGTPADALRRYLEEHGAEVDMYLCGPPPMIDAATQIAWDAGVDDLRIFSEKYG